MAGTTRAKVGTQRRARRHVPSPCAGRERVEHDVLVISIDRLPHVFRVAAGVGRDAPSNG
jgi:hypothetical protein